MVLAAEKCKIKGPVSGKESASGSGCLDVWVGCFAGCSDQTLAETLNGG